MKSEISIIIPTLNEADYLRETLDALEIFGDAEIIVVDGGSTDATVSIAENYRCQNSAFGVAGAALNCKSAARRRAAKFYGSFTPTRLFRSSAIFEIKKALKIRAWSAEILRFDLTAKDLRRSISDVAVSEFENSH